MFGGFRGFLGQPRPASRHAQTVEQRLAMLERNVNNIGAELERLQEYLDSRHVIQGAASGVMALQRVTNLWNILIREGVTRTPY
jgi:hypothetical protein